MPRPGGCVCGCVPREADPRSRTEVGDDFVMTFETHYDAKRVMDVLGKRLSRFGLKLHPDKTRFIDSARSVMAGCPQTARHNRSTSSASPTRGESRGRAR